MGKKSKKKRKVKQNALMMATRTKKRSKLTDNVRKRCLKRNARR